MAVTRIKNNQITDSTITFQKIASGTLTGGLFNANLTLNSNVSIVGNLQVTGNTTTVNSIDTLVNDPLITLNNGYVGSPSYDVGILFNRALGSLGNYGGKNAALVWSETDGAFIVVLTTETGTTSGTINRAFKANLVAGNVTVANALVAESANISSLVTGSLTLSTLRATGNILADSGTTSTTYTTGAIVVPNDGGVGIGGNLNVRGTSDFTGNITAGNILVSGNINVTVGAVASSYGVFYGNAAGIGALYAGTTGYTPIDHTVLQLTSNLNNYSQVNFQNINTGSKASSDFVATADNGDDTDGFIDLGIASSTYADPAFPGIYPNDGYLVHHSALTRGNLLIFSHTEGSSIKFHIGDYGDANVKVTITNSGLRVNTTTTSTSTTSGALIVSGGLGVNGNIHAAAINATPIGNTTPSTGVFTTLTGTDSIVTTLVATNFSSANARVTGGYADNFPIGANTAAPGTFTTVNATTIDAGTSTIATANTTTANITNSKTTTGVVTNFSTANAVVTGGSISGLANITATTGNVESWYAATLNATNANITGAVALGSLNTANAVVTGGYINGLANLTATTTQTTNLSTGNAVVTGGYINGLANLTATTTQTTNLSTGNAVITGGYIEGLGNLTVTTGNVGSWYAATLNATNANITGAVALGSLNTANAVITGGYINSLANITATTAQFTNLSTANAVITGGYLTGLANITATTGNVGSWYTATLNASAANISGPLFATNLNTANAVITGGYINGLANITATTGDVGSWYTATLNATAGNIGTLAVTTGFSTANALITGGYADNFPIGANTKATGAFTTLTTNGATTFTAATQSDNTTTGAVVVTGGVGIGANLNVGGNITVTGNLTVQGTTTTVNSTTVDVADLNITIAKGAASAAAANGAGLTVDGANATITYANSDDSWNFNKKVNLTGITVASANITNGNVTTLVATNFSSGNAIITGGNIEIDTPGGNSSFVQADHVEGYYGVFGNLISTNVEISGGNVTNMWSVSTNNAVITGGAINNTGIGFTTPETGNFTTANATTVTAYTVNTFLSNTTTANITTLVATNFSSGNARITSGYADNFPLGANTASTGNFTVANAATVTAYTVNATTQNATDANVTTLVATNFSSGNARITSGYADNFPLGANTASTGNFTVANAATVTAYTVNVTTLNATTGNITNLSTPTIDTGNITTWGANITSGNITTLAAGTATIATVNTTTANITDSKTTTGVVTNFSTGNARVTGGYADNFQIGANTAATGTFTQVTVSGETKTATLNATSNVYLSPQSGAATVTINPLTPGNMDNMTVGATSAANVYASNFRSATSLWAATTGPVWIKGGTGTSGINSIPIGAVDPSTAVFTTLTATTANASTVNITNGNVTTLVATNFSTGNITLTGVTLSEGNIVANATTASTNTTTGALVVRGGAGIGGAVNTGGQIVTTAAGSATDGAGQLYLNGATSNRIDWAAVGTGAPALTTRSTGTKAVLYPSLSASTTDYAMGIDSATMWSSVPENNSSFNFKWYGATTQIASLGGTGILTVAGNIVAVSGTSSTDTTTGALVVVGGAGIGGNLNIGGNVNSSGNIVINSTKSASTDFIVRGKNENTLIYAVSDTTYDQVSIGGNLTPATILQGAKFGVYSTDALLLPVGASSDRPSGKGFTDVQGMIRFNSTSNQLEYYGNGQWNNTGSTFTTITGRTFDAASGNPYGNVDGANQTFTLSANSSTNGTMVSINGVLQIPTTAYSVSLDQITFTEAPAVGDVIDTRVITTTSTVTGIAGPNGFNSFQASNDYLSFYTGNVSLGSIENWRIDTHGDLYPVTTSNIGSPNKRVDYFFGSNINLSGGSITGATVSSGSLDDTVIGGNVARSGDFTTLSANGTFTTNAEIVTNDIRGKYVAPGLTDAVYGFASATYRSGKFFVQLSDSSGSAYQAAEVVCVHNGTTSTIEVYGVTYTGAANLATFSSNIAGGTVYLNASSAGANLAIKVTPTLMKL
jgi:trimeric autotransporter adhesin